jgi:hypothetical protein
MTTSELLLTTAIRQTDFFRDVAGGPWITGACGPTAVANGATSVLGHIITPKMAYDAARAHGLCDPNGASVLPANKLGLYALAVLLNCKIAAYQPYLEPWPAGPTWIAQQVGAGNPTVIEVANGAALKDEVTGLGDNYNPASPLQYHYIVRLGSFSGGFSKIANKTLPPGGWYADGDSWAGNNGVEWDFQCTQQLQFYSDTTLAAARPCGALALVGKGQQTPMAWTKQSDGRGLDAHGHGCGTGFMAGLESTGMAQYDGLMSETYLTGLIPGNKTSFLPLSNGAVFTYDGAVHIDQAAELAVTLYNALSAKSEASAPAALSLQQEKAIAALAAIKDALAAS